MTRNQPMQSELSAQETVFRLLQRRDYDGALAVARELPQSHPERFSLERVALARDRRFPEAAAAGRQLLAAGLATTEDMYRQAQILLRCGAIEEAFEAGTAALRQSPEDWRLLIPVVEAVLALPLLEARLRDLAEPIVARHPHRPPSKADRPGGMVLHTQLPHCGALGGEHPIFRRLLDALAPLPMYRPETYGTGLVAAALAALPRAQRATEALLAAGIEIERTDAACYVAARFPGLLADDGGCEIEMQWHLPNSLGEIPYFFHFDFMPMLFLPFAAAEHMAFPQQDPGIYRILKHQLESPACLGILTHTRDAARQFGEVFESPLIQRKCTLINAPSDIADRSVASERMPPIRGRQDTVTLFFAASASFTEDGFFARGGVDVLNAFAELSEEFGNLRLILRGQLPASLSPRLALLAREHPGIRWLPDRLAQEAHEALLDESDIFVMPSIGTFRNGLVQALRLGLVPVVSDCFYAEDFVEDGVTGLVARGRGHVTQITTRPAGFRSDWRAIYGAVDRPSDPAFFENFKDAIRKLVTDRGLLQRISTRNLTVPTPHEMQEVDIRLFRDVIHAGIARARDMARQPTA